MGKAKTDKPHLKHFIKSVRCEALRVRVEKTIEIYPCDLPECFQGPYRDILKFVLEIDDGYDSCLKEGLERLAEYIGKILDGYSHFADENMVLYDNAPTWLVDIDENLPTDQTIAENEDLENMLEDVNEMYGYLKPNTNRWTKLSIFDELLRGQWLSGIIEAKQLANIYLAKFGAKHVH